MSKSKKIRRLEGQGVSARDGNAIRMQTKHELERLCGDRPPKTRKKDR